MQSSFLSYFLAFWVTLPPIPPAQWQEIVILLVVQTVEPAAQCGMLDTQRTFPEGMNRIVLSKECSYYV